MSGGKAKKRRDKAKARVLTPEEVMLYAMLDDLDVWRDPETGEVFFADKEGESPVKVEEKASSPN